MGRKKILSVLLKVNGTILFICVLIELFALLAGIIFHFIQPEFKNLKMENFFHLVILTIITYILLYVNKSFKKKFEKENKHDGS